MNDKRNIGILGVPDSGASEVFEAIKRHSDKKPLIIEYTEGMFLIEYVPPYDAKKRDKFMKGLNK